MSSIRAKEVAVRIVQHLRNIEADPKGSFCNQPSAYVKKGWVVISYDKEGKNYPLQTSDAYQYLNWLDAGNVGPHWESQPYWPTAVTERNNT